MTRGSTALAVLAAVFVLLLIALPLTTAVNYQFNRGVNSYTQQEYPLNKAVDWLFAAGANVPENPQGVLTDTSNAWALMNQSQIAVAAAFGNNQTACWLWPTQAETYGFYASLYAQVYQSVTLYIEGGGIFHNSTLTSWTGVLGDLLILNGGMQNNGSQNAGLESCLGNTGNEQGFILGIIWMLFIPGFLLSYGFSRLLR